MRRRIIATLGAVLYTAALVFFVITAVTHKPDRVASAPHAAPSAEAA